MAILGRNGTLSPPFGNNIINVTKTEEQEAVDVSNRGNTGDGYKVYQAGFKTVTWDIECHDPGTAIADLTAAGTGCTVLSVNENISVDGAVTFTISAKGGS
jgi:hypothetical protein